MIVVEGSVFTPLSEQVAQCLGVPFVRARIQHFPAHEWDVHLDQSVENQHVIIVHGMHTPNNRQPLSGHTKRFISIHDALMVSLLIGRIAQQKGAATITFLCPFMPYSRQNQGGILCIRNMLLNIIIASGIDHIMTLDMHGPDTHLSTSLCNIHSTSLWQEHIQKRNDVTVIAPDQGSKKRAALLAQSLDNRPYICLHKNRLADGSCHITPPIWPLVEHQHIVIVDDILDTGSTLYQTIQSLPPSQSISLYITHALWSENCMQTIQQLPINHIFISDSVTCHTPLPHNVHTVPIAPLLARHIKHDPFYRTHRKRTSI